jgi:hypothetical protein
MNFNTRNNVYGDNIAKQISVFNTPSTVNAKTMRNLVATRSYDNFVQSSLGSVHILNRLKTPRVRASSYTAYPTANKGAALVGAFGPT